MFHGPCQQRTRFAFIVTLAAVFIAMSASAICAADHAESTSVAGDPGADIADIYVFLDPNDPSKVILALDVEGFVVPSEFLNLSFFAPEVLYRFEIENTGDATPDLVIDITFSEQTSRSAPQMATVKLPDGHTFTAPTTVQTLAPVANPFVVTTDPASGVSFFAGLTDDPFIFDIVGFNRFVNSVLAGSPDPTQLERGRDSFAGYSIHMIALSVPAELLRGPAGDIIGVDGVTLRRKRSYRLESGEVITSGNFVQVDRMATPAINTVLIPFPRKNEYNAATPEDDAAGVFVDSIVATLTALGTSPENIDTVKSIAVTKGDYLRLDLSKENHSLGVGEFITDPGYAGFPNGRRPGDDTIDVLLYVITNQNSAIFPEDKSKRGDNVSVNDVPFGSTFPFFAPPQQPRTNPPGEILTDDNTRN
jgi:hypothetical protein